MKPTPPFRHNKRRLFLWLAFIALVVGIVWAAVSIMTALSNYAEQVARPLEVALVKAGAVKKHNHGDGGRGPDNRTPWYRGYLELAANRDRAVELIHQVAAANGYQLTHASPSNRGHLPPIDDEYIDQWYFDTTGKPHPFRDLSPGAIELAFSVVTEKGMTLYGLNDVLNPDGDHTIIAVHIKLPPFVYKVSRSSPAALDHPSSTTATNEL